MIFVVIAAFRGRLFGFLCWQVVSTEVVDVLVGSVIWDEIYEALASFALGLLSIFAIIGFYVALENILQAQVVSAT